MRTAVVYVEGGSKGSLAVALRGAFVEFLKPILSVTKQAGWKVVIEMCGARDSTWDRFNNWRLDPKKPEVAILLVDSEEPIAEGAKTPLNEQAKRHLIARESHWSLGDHSPLRIHAMVCIMETWFLADAKALKEYYGSGFNEGALDGCGLPETVPKHQVYDKLGAAARKTAKRAYLKGRDSAGILRLLNPDVVRGACPHCDRLFQALLDLCEV